MTEMSNIGGRGRRNQESRELPSSYNDTGRSNVYRVDDGQANLCSNRVFQRTVVLFSIVAITICTRTCSTSWFV